MTFFCSANISGMFVNALLHGTDSIITIVMKLVVVINATSELVVAHSGIPVQKLHKYTTISKLKLVIINFIDIPNCDFDNGGCNGTCINTNGSYYCTCDAGYTLNISDQHNCSSM